MRELIKKALTDAMIKLDRQTPTTKKDIVIIDLDEKDVKPIDLIQFMKDNNIPDDCYFSTTYEDTQISSYVAPSINYEIDIPTTKEDKLKFRRKKFTSIAWYFVYKILIENGYKRIGFNSGLLREFDDTTIYDMYISKDFDRLVKYYSMSFNK